MDLLDQIDVAAATGLLYVGVMSALTVPDIAGGLQAPDGLAKGSLYAAWFDHWLGDQYGGFMNGWDCYYFRCSLLHQGRSEHGKSRLGRVMFVEPNAFVTIHRGMSIINGEATLTLDPVDFCNEMTAAARAWLGTVKGTEPFETNFAAFVHRRPNGYPPHIVGVPIIT